jgi:nitroreductase
MSNVIAPDELLSQLRWRYATKKFDPARRIPDEDWAALEEALILTPSSYGLQPWKFIVITDPAMKAKLPAISWNQRQVQDASHTVVFARRLELTEEYIDHYLSRIAWCGGTVEGLGFRKMLMGVCSAAAGLQSPALGVPAVLHRLGELYDLCGDARHDTCPMEGIARQYDELLGLSAQGYATVVVGVQDSERLTTHASVLKVRFGGEHDERI